MLGAPPQAQAQSDRSGCAHEELAGRHTLAGSFALCEAELASGVPRFSTDRDFCAALSALALFDFGAVGTPAPSLRGRPDRWGARHTGSGGCCPCRRRYQNATALETASCPVGCCVAERRECGAALRRAGSARGVMRALLGGTRQNHGPSPGWNIYGTVAVDTHADHRRRPVVNQFHLAPADGTTGYELTQLRVSLGHRVLRSNSRPRQTRCPC